MKILNVCWSAFRKTPSSATAASRARRLAETRKSRRSRSREAATPRRSEAGKRFCPSISEGYKEVTSTCSTSWATPCWKTAVYPPATLRPRPGAGTAWRRCRYSRIRSASILVALPRSTVVW